MSDYISKAEAIEWLKDDVIATIKSIPTADVQPVRHGKWIKLDMHEHLADHKCTACGQECYVPICMGEPMYIYCPNCGARMDEE
jgi:DNA-directed RNA polymerase subunit RPC12/RpoP